MIIGTAKIYTRISWANSLKEKRMVSRSLMAKVKNKFNVSICEVEENDAHKSLVIGIACVSNDKRHANSQIDEIINFIYENTEIEVVDIIIEIL